MKRNFNIFTPPSAADLAGFASAGDVAGVQALLDLGVPVDARDGAGLTALMHAASAGKNAVLRLLLEAGADIDATSKNGGTALTSAAWTGSVDTVRLLLDEGADMRIRTQGWTALMCAARRHGNGGDHVKTVRLLAERGARVDEASDGWTALMHAAIRGDREMTQALLGLGADAALRNNDGDTAPSVAIKYGHADLADLFKDPPPPAKPAGPRFS